jgi:primosomal protein N' (replication factor Y)
MKCKSCDAILVYHFENKKLVCHYCNHTVKPPDVCPKCMSAYIKYLGIGTEKVESELARMLQGARISRMDTDSTAKRGSHDTILKEFREHKLDVLVGTQMIAKGHDFPKVTLVGVVNADVTLNLPDFRSGERTFNLMTQVAGRAGRGDEGGEVIIQTYAPSNYAILAASKHDYESFYEIEIKMRRELRFPPFSRLILITLRSRDTVKAETAAVNMAALIKKEIPDVEVLGPAPNAVAKVRGYYRWNILLKGSDRSKMTMALRKCVENMRRPAGVLTAVDVDPTGM